MRVIRPLRELSVDRFRVHLLDAGQALQVQTPQKPFEQGVDVDVPQIRVFVDSGLDLEHEFGQCLQRVGHAGQLEPVFWVAEDHQHEVVRVVQLLNTHPFLLIQDANLLVTRSSLLITRLSLLITCPFLLITDSSLLIQGKGHTPQHIHLQVDLLPPETKPSIDKHPFLPLLTHILELCSLQLRVKNPLQFLTVIVVLAEVLNRLLAAIDILCSGVLGDKALEEGLGDEGVADWGRGGAFDVGDDL
jgi:hypothetical protein